ncbi:ABC transporter permease [Gracilibacillus sp. JCM 18860]|uniref:ABC transporter permease n=1 Tax=Gracilibacillus sp. JCM 18860 TaxID=1306159 RepID=UPI000AF8F79E
MLKIKGFGFGLLFYQLYLLSVLSLFFPVGEEMDTQALVTQIVPGYTVMFSFFIIISIVIAFVKERDGGMVARIASTPLPINRYFIGKWIPFMLIVIIQIIVLFTFGVLVYDLPLGDPLSLIVLSFVLAFLSTSWGGMAMAVLVKTENMGIALTQIIALGGAMLGGLWMPLDMMPAFIQATAKFLPQFWALDGYKNILLEGGTIMDIWLSILILLSFGLIGAIIAFVSYPRFLRQSKS